MLDSNVIKYFYFNTIYMSKVLLNAYSYRKNFVISAFKFRYHIFIIGVLNAFKKVSSYLAVMIF